MKTQNQYWGELPWADLRKILKTATNLKKNSVIWTDIYFQALKEIDRRFLYLRNLRLKG